MAAQLEHGQAEFMLFGLGGKGSTDIQFLQEFGVKTAWLIPDQPFKQGDGWAQSVVGNGNNFISSAGTQPLQFRVFQWPVGLRGGDLDEAIQEHGYKDLLEYLYISRNAHFLNSCAWITKQVDAALEKIDKEHELSMSRIESEGEQRQTEVSNLTASYREFLEQEILRGFRLLHITSEKQEYVGKYVTDRGIDIATLEKVYSEMYALDTIQGVVDRVSDHLKQYIEMAYYIGRQGDNTVYAWSKKNQELIEIPTSERALCKTIALFTEHDLEQWFDSMFGHNPVYCEGIDTGDHGLVASKKRRANAKYILEKSLDQCISKGLKNYRDLTKLSQGIHHLDLPAELRQEGYIYMVNGHKVFRGQFKDGGVDMEWTRVQNAVDKGVVFEDLSLPRTWSLVSDITDLYSASTVDLKKVYNSIRTILNGWVFHNHDVVAQYLAAWIMSIPIMRAMSDVNITLLTGEKISGKTSLAAGLLGGNGVKRNVCPAILESVCHVDNATLPSIYQTTVGKSHLVIFDEAERGEKYNTRYGEVLDEFLRLVHSMPHGGVLVGRGGRVVGEQVEYLLRYPILLAAIHPPSDVTFLSRTTEVRTQKQQFHIPIEEFIYRYFTDEMLGQLRKAITVCLIQHIPELTMLRKHLADKLQKVGRKEANVSNRFLQNVLTPLTVYEFVNGNSEDLYRGIVDINRDRLYNSHSEEAQNDLLTACLYTKCIRMNTTDAFMDSVSAQYLLINENYDVLNNSSSGVFFSVNMMAIVIVWRQAKFGALERTKYGSWEVSLLRDTAQKSESAVSNITQSQHEALCRELRLQDVHSRTGYTVLNLNYLVADDAPIIEKLRANLKEQNTIGVEVAPKKEETHEPKQPEDFQF